MTEVLVVVAIVAVLAGIAVPSVMAVQKNLKMTELDSAAKSIFVAAQNRMSELRASGELKELSAASMYSKPSDFPEDAEAKSWPNDEYKYLAGNDGEIARLLPSGAVDATLMSNTFFVEYNAKTGMVYGVFYSDNSFQYGGGNVEPLRESVEVRKGNSPLIGYYGGSTIDYADLEPAKMPEWDLVNAEELYIEIIPDSSQLSTYSLMITNESGTVSLPVVGDFKSNATIVWPAGVTYENGRFKIVLDSLTGGQFKNKFSSFTPGEDITITLTVDSGSGTLPAVDTRSANSLFASRDPENSSVVIMNARHLQNLQAPYSGLSEIDVTSASQRAGIVWDGESYGKFASIDNLPLKSGNSLMSYDGGSNPIVGLNSALFDDFAGNTRESAELKNIRIVNPSIAAANVQNAGTLVNTASYAVISKCGALASEDIIYFDTAVLEAPGATSVGGLIGSANACEISESFASLTRLLGGSGSTGGFVGSAAASNISQCYADTGIWMTTSFDWHANSGLIASGGYSGGFAGSVSGGTSVSKSYAHGSLSSARGTIGGFAGSVNTSAITGSYSAAIAESDSGRVYGFAPPGYGSGCYFLKSEYKGQDEIFEASDGRTYTQMLELFSNDSAWTSASVATTNAYGQIAANGAAGPIYPFKRLSSIAHYGDWRDYAPLVYYYEMYIKESDVGNPDAEVVSYGFHAYMGEREYSSLLTAQELAASGLVIYEDGYALVSELHDAGERISVSYSGRKPSDPWALRYNLPLTAERVAENGNPDPVIAFFIRPSADGTGLLETITYSSNSQSPFTINCSNVSYGGRTYYLFSRFAKLAFNGRQTPAIPLSMIYEIRTPRHLYNLYRYSGSGMVLSSYALTVQKNYAQTANIDFTKYRVAYEMQSIGAAYGLSNCSYDGGGYVITGTSIGSAGRGGLFASIGNSTIVRNIRLISDLDSGAARTITGAPGSASTGGLAGSAGGSCVIENCIVAGFDISGEGNVGGLVGTSSSASIRNSAAVLWRNEGALGGSISLNNVSFAGGLVGQINSSSVSIDNSYALTSFIGDNSSVVRMSSIYSKPADDTWLRDRYRNCYGIAMYGGEYVGNTAKNTNPISGSYYENIVSFDGGNIDDINAFSALSGWGEATQERSFAYDSALKNRAYPYPVSSLAAGPSQALSHYGNWPFQNIEPLANGFYYYELYSDGSYGYYGEGSGENGISSLKNDIPVVEDGYVFFLNSGNSGQIKVTTNGANRVNANPTSVTVAGETYQAFYVRPQDRTININDNFNGSSGGGLFSILFEKGNWSQTFYFNPNFAKTASLTQKTVTQYEVRTARHLSQLGALTEAWNGYGSASFIQTRNIDFQSYRPGNLSYTLKIIGRTEHFSGTYDGGGYTITGSGINGGSSATTGLFGYANGGTLKNISFVSDTAGASARLIKGTTDTGALVGRVEGSTTITNCRVIGFNVEGTNGVGGLVGRNNGSSIENSFALSGFGSGVPNTIRGSENVGGLVGYSNSASTIKNCAAAGYSISGTSYVGGFMGRNTNAAISGCAAVNYTVGAGGGSVSGTSNTGGFIGQQNGGSISQCYAIATLKSGSARGFSGGGWSPIASSYCFAFFDDGSSAGFGGSNNSYCLAYSGTKESLEEITVLFGAWGVPSAQDSHPYDAGLTGMNYPFPSPLRTSGSLPLHYGNWPVISHTTDETDSGDEIQE